MTVQPRREPPDPTEDARLYVADHQDVGCYQCRGGDRKSCGLYRWTVKRLAAIDRAALR